ncbi:FMN-binding protein [Marinilactibacillus sp. 15R]|uniref:FMN-binding protein n=1 Tax=Marinilactibacillus sp. 15R TaxID=1911586 RepID=UPI00090C1109|nr:FMN-binding protein [Marinilactibacillus sp. 15R]API87936.1 FMN-binding protein [Marinilactibacillus sp. 15R]
MKIMKSFKFATTLFASTLILAACGNSDEAEDTEETTTEESTTEESEDQAATGELQDGTYSLEEQNFDENGWRVVFDMTVDGGEITESNYDYKNEAGDLKSEDEGYQEAMSEKVGVGPADYLPDLNSQLVEVQDPSEVDVVSGATQSSESFIKYSEQLIDAAEEGNTEMIEVDNAAE